MNIQTPMATIVCAGSTVAILLALTTACGASDAGRPAPWAADRAAADADMASSQYQEAISLYERAIATAESSRSDAATKDAIGKMLIGEGNGFLKLHRTEEAEAAYEKAAPMSSNPGTAYFNLCATYYNTGNTTAALRACDKAIQSDPSKADAYFVKGSALFGNGAVSGGKYTVPPGTVEALNKYLELAPSGPHAGDVKQMLDSLK